MSDQKGDTSPRSSSKPAAKLELRLLGTPRLSLRARTLRLALKRAWALLGYLALNPGPVPRAHLAPLLWPDANETIGRTRLRRLLYAIEQVLGPAALVADGTHVALAAEGCSTDTLEFARFARAAMTAPAFDEAVLAQASRWIEAARAPLMRGITFGSGAFDDWLRAQAIEHEHLLARLLERVIREWGQRERLDTAIDLAEVLISLDPYREPSHVLLMQLHAQRAHRAGVEAAYLRCAELLRSEFGIKPSPGTEQAYVQLSGELARPAAGALPPAIRFAEGEHGSVAYTVIGTGDRTLVLAPGFVCHIEIVLENAGFRSFVHALAERFRVILFDRRGVGLSERLSATGTPVAMAADMSAILDHAGVSRAWVFGSSEGGLGAMRMAIDQPQRVIGLCLFGALARGSAAPDYPWAMPSAAYDVWLKRLVAAWGGPAGLETFAPLEQQDPALRAWWARLVRHAASPGGLEVILAGLRDTDIRADLGRIAVPTLVMHRRGDRAVRFGAGEHLARCIPGATWLPLEGEDHFCWCGDRAAVARAVLSFTESCDAGVR